MEMKTSIECANKRLVITKEILDELQLLNRLAKIGLPIVVGATAYGLIVNPDIDIEIYCIEPKAEDGFTVLTEISKHPKVKEIKFKNCLETSDQGLYFQIRYLHYDVHWKIDMWILAENHPGPTAREFLNPMLDALTEETREAIIEIKEELIQRGEKYPSIYIYQSVLDGNARTIEDFYRWYEANNKPTGLTDWVPLRKDSSLR